MRKGYPHTYARTVSRKHPMKKLASLVLALALATPCAVPATSFLHSVPASAIQTAGGPSFCRMRHVWAMPAVQAWALLRDGKRIGKKAKC